MKKTMIALGMAAVFVGAQARTAQAHDHGPAIAGAATPVSMCFRRLLEECTTVDEAEKLLRQQSRNMMCNLAMCDRTQAAVFEVTPKVVIRRAADAGLCPCTNHFRSKELGRDTRCWRYESAWRVTSENREIQFGLWTPKSVP